MTRVLLRNVLLGRRLANREAQERKIGAFEAVAAMGLDGLGSSAYGPEAALTALVPLGTLSLAYIGPVIVPILVLLTVLYFSYRQTLRAYPGNGGAYLVAKENLGQPASLLAAAALMVDYVLNVAVGISAGVAALVSALPSLHPYILPLCLAMLTLITLMNLRGTVDASRIVAVPTYLFIASFALILGLGLWRTLSAGGAPQPVVPPATLPAPAETVTLWLLLRAFASGCTAMTGVEAVSNGMSAFREPAIVHGRRTLTAIVVLLGALLASIAYLAQAYAVGAMDQSRTGYRSVLSQLGGAIVGEGPLYYVAIGSLLCVLALSANTSFVGFPRLCRLVACDGFLPKPFAVAGHRLVFSAGIVYLAVCAGLLLIMTGGITDHLIPLFAIGAFLTFTLSQSGMVMHWWRARAHGTREGHAGSTSLNLWTNAVGAVATAAALLVIVIAKFREGAWITVIVVPATIVLLRSIRGYYDAVEAKVADPTPLELQNLQPPIVLVTIEGWSRLADRALTLAMTLSPDVVGVHLVQLAGPDEQRRRDELQANWERNVAAPARDAGVPVPEFVVLPAPYRSIHQPVLELARRIELRRPGRTVAVLIPELVMQHWYQRLLHTGRAGRLRRQLLRHGGSRLTVINVPWYLEEQRLPVVTQG
jgi:amino acid transporter